MYPKLLKQFEFIAKQHGIETLETRKSDGLDFHDLAVWSLKDMMEAAYSIGYQEALEDIKKDKK